MKAARLVHVERPLEGWVRLVLDAPPGNIVSMAMCESLLAALAQAAQSETKFISIEGAGAHFSYGASVEEHAPDRVGAMLPAFHHLIGGLLAVEAPTAAIVRGRCLGGGLELALACDLVFAAADARLGVPEVLLGVFPPAAAALLPLRIGASRASRVVLGGDALPAAWWESAGLVTATAPAAELDGVVRQWFEAALAPRSAVALRHAAGAARAILREQVTRTLPGLERQYLEALMQSDDAVEGCAAFVEKRTPVWRNR